MNLKNKRGQTNMISKVVGVIFGVFILALIVLTAININDGFSSALGTAFTEVSEGTTNVIGPLFRVLLGTDGATGDNAFLMILAFILILIIVVGTLDSVNIFGDGETSQGGLINFVIGVIVSIIGVRFMPQNMWGALTAPSSAFVATILVGIPFVALFFVSMKVKSRFARKLLWGFYLIFMSYLIFSESGGANSDFKWVYLAFLVAAGVMAFFDASVRKLFYSEKRRANMEKKLAGIDVLKRKDIRLKVEKWSEVINDVNASASDLKTARSELTKLRTLYGEDLTAI